MFDLAVDSEAIGSNPVRDATVRRHISGEMAERALIATEAIRSSGWSGAGLDALDGRPVLLEAKTAPTRTTWRSLTGPFAS